MNTAGWRGGRRGGRRVGRGSPRPRSPRTDVVVFADVLVKVEVLPLEGAAREAADEALVALLVFVVIELLAPARGARGGRQGGVREGDAPDNDVNEDCLTPAPKTKSASAARQAGAATSAKCFSRLLSCQCRTLPNSSPLPLSNDLFSPMGSETMSFDLETDCIPDAQGPGPWPGRCEALARRVCDTSCRE